MAKEKLILSFYGSHNAAAALYNSATGEYKVVEVERWLNVKNAGLTTYLPCKYPQIVFDEICDYLLSQTGRTDVDVLLTDYVQNITPKFLVKERIGFDHHTAHAATALYQSPYQECLIITFDGGGDGSFFNVYLGNRKTGIKLLDKFDHDLGFPYMVIGDHIKDIKKEALNIGNLVYAGKLMGLASYGKVHDEWLPYFDEFYDKFHYKGSSYIGGAEAKYNALTTLFKKLGVEDFDIETTRFEGQFAWDIVATSQRSFEDQFFKYAQKYLDMYPDLPLAISGGCALNVLLNAKLLKLKNGKVFVPPNVNDCGIAVGGLLWYVNPDIQVDLTYSGLPILDKNEFGAYIQNYNLNVYDDVTLEELATYLADGNIVGMIQGNSEHGSRALGNRSIICNPVGDMKDVLNRKVKHREWYRPFAPIVRLEDTTKYFEWEEGVESRHMTFVATVKEEWRKKLPAITHEDNTARLQTVTKSQNELIYNLIGEFEKIAGHGVILNTSFNVDGKPILTRLSDAFKILNDTELDAIYYDGKLVCKSSNDKFGKIRDKKNPKKNLSDDTTLYVLSFKEGKEDIDNDIQVIKSLLENEKNLVVLLPSENLKYYKASIDTDGVKYFPITSRHHFYDQRLEKALNIRSKSTLDYSKYIRLLWCKDVLKENFFNTNYHLFINLDQIKASDINVQNVELLKQVVKNDEFVFLTSKKKLDVSFSEEYVKEKFKSEKIKQYPISEMFGGNVDNLGWFFLTYEGTLLWHVGMEKIGNENDYLLLTAVEHSYRYKLFDT